MLITIAVFSMLMIAAFAVVRMGTNASRSVNAKTDVQQALRGFESDITTELKRSFVSTVGIYTPSNDYHWAIWFKTAMNNGVDVAISGVLGDPVNMITFHGTPIMQRYVLYYVGLMDPSEHNAIYGNTCATTYANPTVGPDTLCPHKWIIKKDIYLTDSSNNDSIGSQSAIGSNPANLQRYLTDQENQVQLVSEPTSPPPGEPNNVARAHVVCENVVSFELARLSGTGVGTPPTPSATGRIILFDVKAFKVDEASRTMTIGTSPIVTVSTTGNTVNVVDKVTSGVQQEAFTSSVVNNGFQPYTVQLDNRIVPENP